MKHFKNSLGQCQVLLFVSFLLSSCAQLPTTEEMANIDYGSCPQNYEKVIKERFQGDLLSGYASEPTIWPPQKYWYKDTFTGSTLQAGYLVPAMAELTRGNPLLLGRRLYGFVFKNDEMIREMNPNIMQRLNISELVGPFPKDERDWKEGNFAQQGDHTNLEYVLPGETVEGWTELVSVQILSGVPLSMSVENFVMDIADAHRSRRPGCVIVSQEVLSSTSTEVLYEQTLEKCAPFRDEYSVRKAIRGPRSMTEVSYSKTSKLTDAERDKWTAIVGQTTSMSECR